MLIRIKLPKLYRYCTNIIYFAILWSLSVLNYANVDYENYRLIYEYYIPNDLGLTVMPDIGYYILCRVGIKFGISFFTFRGIYITIALVFFIVGIDYFSSKSKKIYFLYILYPFFFDIVQFRFFMAVAITIYAMRFLSQGKKVIYILLVLLGATQHASILAYLLFLLSYYDYKKLKKIVFAITASFSIIFIAAPGLLSRLFGGIFAQVNTYLSYSTGTIYLFFVHFALTICAIAWNELMVKKEKNEINHFLDKVLLIMLCFTPFIILDDDYMRLYRGVLVLLYLCLYRHTKSYCHVNMKNLVPVCYCTLMFYTFLSPHSITNWKYVTEPILNSNYLLDFLK